jgi:hypothetical protein
MSHPGRSRDAGSTLPTAGTACRRISIAGIAELLVGSTYLGWKMKRREFIAASVGIAGFVIPVLGRAATPCPPPQVSIGGGSTAATNCGTSGRSFSTSFDLAEASLSENGAWVHQASAWKNVQTKGGHASPAGNVGAHFDDCYSRITGFPPDQQVEATIYKGGEFGGETELLLRVTDTATTVSCYECLFNVGGGVDIVRWNGPLDSFTYVGNVIFTPYALDGDKIRARIVGQAIEFYYIPKGTGSPQLMATANDTSSARLTSGNPGIGFFQRAPGSLDYGFKDFSATAL